MTTNISQQLGMSIRPSAPKAGSIESQLGLSNSNYTNLLGPIFGGLAVNQYQKKNPPAGQPTKAQIDAANKMVQSSYAVNANMSSADLQNTIDLIDTALSQQAERVGEEKSGFGKFLSGGRQYKLSGKNAGTARTAEEVNDAIATINALSSQRNKAVLQQQRTVTTEKKAADDAAKAEAAKAAADEKAKQQQITALQKQISETADPNAKKQLTDQLNSLTGNVAQATGLSKNKVVLYGGVAVAAIAIYYFFIKKSNNA
jgi:hypothetical protein